MAPKFITSITSSTTLSPGFNLYLVDATSGSLTLTLPTMTIDGENYNLRRLDATTNTITVTGTGGQTIDSLSSVTIPVSSNLEVTSYQSAWYVTEGHSNESGLISRSVEANFFQIAGGTGINGTFLDTSGNTSENQIWIGTWPGGVLTGAIFTTGASAAGTATLRYRVHSGSTIAGTLLAEADVTNPTGTTIQTTSVSIAPTPLSAGSLINVTMQTSTGGTRARIYSFFLVIV